MRPNCRFGGDAKMNARFVKVHNKRGNVAEGQCAWSIIFNLPSSTTDDTSSLMSAILPKSSWVQGEVTGLSPTAVNNCKWYRLPTAADPQDER